MDSYETIAAELNYIVEQADSPEDARQQLSEILSMVQTTLWTATDLWTETHNDSS